MERTALAVVGVRTNLLISTGSIETTLGASLKSETLANCVSWRRAGMDEPRRVKPLSLPVWLNVLVVQGCRLDTGSRLLPITLEAVGDSLQCTPAYNGSMLPFQVPVHKGETVTIRWDTQLARYVVESMGRKTAA